MILVDANLLLYAYHPRAEQHEASEAGSGFWRAFFGELRRLGHFEGRDLIFERYSAEGHPGRYSDLAQEVVSLNPDIVFVTGNQLARAFRPWTGTTPIVANMADPL